MNKRGSDEINAGTFLVFVVIISAAVTVLLASYTNSPVDVRSMESKILYENLMNCFVENGFVKENVMASGFNVFSYCHINESVLNSSEIYFQFDFFNETDMAVRESLISNKFSRKNDCDALSATKDSNSIACLYKNETYFYLKDNEIKSVKIVGWVASFHEGVRDV